MSYTNGLDDPSAYFQTKIYTGDGNNNRAITNDGNSDLQPDFIWLKDRNVGFGHRLTDSTRGITKNLASETTGAESTSTTQYASWNTDGFTLIYGGQQVPNYNGHTYVAWQWKANGGTTASNSDGTITSTTQVNSDAGFSIITYTGNASNSTVGHGLGVQPSVIINKKRSATASWSVWHSALLGTQLLELNTTGATATVAAIWNSTVPTSSVFSIGTDGQTNSNNTTYVTYAFAEKQGYSKFGKYVGNGNANGSFVYTGFKPAWILFKKINSAGTDWMLYDNKREPNNPVDQVLFPSLSNAESGGDATDILSNGFKQRSTGSSQNASGDTYIYMAFAENPFTTSTGIPTTAR